MVRKLDLIIPTGEMYAKLAAEQAKDAKRIKEKLTNECNTLLNAIKKKLLKKESFDNIINNKDNKELEDLRTDLMSMLYYLK